VCCVTFSYVLSLSLCRVMIILNIIFYCIFTAFVFGFWLEIKRWIDGRILSYTLYIFTRILDEVYCQSIVNAELPVVQLACFMSLGCWSDSSVNGWSSEHIDSYIFTSRNASYAEYFFTTAWYAVSRPSARYTYLHASILL